jgi:hypothetical protein
MTDVTTEPVVEETAPVEEETEIKDAKAVLAALERAKADAKTFREQMEAAKAELETVRAEMQTIVSTQAEKQQALNDSLLDLHIEKELVKRGLSSQGERVRKYLSRDGVSIGEDSKPVGLNEAFGTLEKDFPEIFDPKKRVGGSADLFQAPDVKVNKSTTELQLERLQHKS